jgi:hypothetical protein
MEAVYAEVDTGTFADFGYLFFDLFGGFGYDLLNTGRVNTTIRYQTV